MKKMKEKYNINDYTTYDSYNKERKLLTGEVIHEIFCNNCKEFHIPINRKCPNCGNWLGGEKR